jgi:di/tricarboxylate transporter
VGFVDRSFPRKESTHHGNLLVYGPGRYKFADFVKVGTPLTVICALLVVLLAPLIWQG